MILVIVRIVVVVVTAETEANRGRGEVDYAGFVRHVDRSELKSIVEQLEKFAFRVVQVNRVVVRGTTDCQVHALLTHARTHTYADSDVV